MRTITKIGKRNQSYFAQILPPQGSYEMALGAIEDGMPVGALSFFVEDEVVDIDSIYIIPESRGGGVGSELLTSLSQIAADNNALGLRATFPNDEQLCAFFEKNGFFTFPGDVAYGVNVTNLLKATDDILAKVNFKNIIPLCKGSSANRKEIQKFSEDAGYGNNALSILECNEELSFILLGEGNRVSGFILADMVDNNIYVDMLFVKKTKNSSGLEAIKLIGALLNTIKQRHLMAELFCFYAENESTYKLLLKFIKNEKQIRELILNYKGIKSLRDEL